jgi:hypothetical protein
VLSAGPIAVTQSPVASWVDVAAAVVVTVAELPTVTLTDFVTNWGFFASCFLLGVLVFGIRAFTVTVVPFTTVTGPDAVARFVGRRPLVGNDGLVPDPPPKPPRNPPAPAPPGVPRPNPPVPPGLPVPAKPNVQVDDVGWLIETVVALMPLAVLPVPVARTQSPTVIDDTVSSSTNVNVVVGVTVTVVCPVVPWTSSVDPTKLAILPVANEALGRGVVVVVVVADAAAGPRNAEPTTSIVNQTYGARVPERGCAVGLMGTSLVRTIRS